MSRLHGLPLRWIERAAQTGMIPGLRVDHGWRFDPEAVSAALWERAGICSRAKRSEPVWLVSVEQLAQQCSVKRSCVRTLAAAGVLPSLRWANRTFFVRDVARPLLIDMAFFSRLPEKKRGPFARRLEVAGINAEPWVSILSPWPTTKGERCPG